MKKYPFLTVSSLVVISVLGIGASVIRLDPQAKDHGIGPVKNVELGPLNKKMADEGKAIFTTKCFLCHELDQKKIGPPLRNITKDRAPEYIMNLIVNSVQMQKEDPNVKALIKKYNNVIMPPPGINQTQARSVLEYLRSVAK
jgi:cytochrome c